MNFRRMSSMALFSGGETSSRGRPHHVLVCEACTGVFRAAYSLILRGPMKLPFLQGR